MATQPLVGGNGNGHSLATVPAASFSWENAEELKQAIRETYAKGSSDAQFLVFWEECKRRRAHPGKHIHFRLQRQKEKEWDDVLHQQVERWVSKPIFITAIDFMRLTAQRTGQYGGQKPQLWIYKKNEGDAKNGVPPTFVESDVPLPMLQPYAAKATVIRKDFVEPLTRIARWDAFAQTYKPDNGPVTPNQMWAKMGPEQLFKCAEAQALRAAFPEELGGLYVSEEIPEELEALSAQPAVAPALSPAPQAIVLPPMNHAPATAVKEQAAPEALSVPTAPKIEIPPTHTSPSDGTAATHSMSKATAPSSEKTGVTIEDVQKRFGGILLRPAEAKGAEGFKWYLRNVFDPAQVKGAGAKLQAFVLKAAGKSSIKDVSEAQKTALLELLDKTYAKEGPTGVIALVDGDSKKGK